jgi:hypothetical protein
LKRLEAVPTRTIFKKMVETAGILYIPPNESISFTETQFDAVEQLRLCGPRSIVCCPPETIRCGYAILDYPTINVAERGRLLGSHSSRRSEKKEKYSDLSSNGIYRDGAHQIGFI